MDTAVPLSATEPAFESTLPGGGGVVKIKEEKVDPEVEAKVNALCKVAVKRENVEQEKNEEKSQESPQNSAPGSADSDDEDDDDDEEEDEEDEVDGNSNDTQEDDKKAIEPVKSSNEILAELFKVFNAAPPEELLDDKSLIKKSHKHKKHKKEKKKKIKREKKSEGERSDTDSSGTREGEAARKDKKYKHKHKKKKKHKEKHKEAKEKKKEGAKESPESVKRKSKERHRSKEKSHERSKERERERGKTPPVQRPAIKAEREEENSRTDRQDARKRQGDPQPEEASAAKHSRSSNNRERDRGQERSKERNSFYNGYRDEGSIRIKTEPKESPRSRGDEKKKNDGHISEISLSDEDSYQDSRDALANGGGDSKRRGFGFDPTPRSRAHNSFYAGAERSRSRDTGKERERDRTRDRDRDRDRERNRSRGREHLRERSRYHGSGGRHGRTRSRTRSRSRSRSRDLGIDKKRLLEIARKNAISMFKRGNLPGCADMSQEVKDKVLLKMRYGGRTVQDLTDFCKKISNGENLSDLSSDEDSDVDKNGNTKPFHHPFQLKEREPIVMHIRNATPIVPRKATTTDQTKAITMQFPVSSGQQHRMTEAWVPVEPKESLAPLPALPAASQSTTIFKATPMTAKNVFEKPMPVQEQQEPAFKPMLPVINATAAVTANETNTNVLPPPKPVAAPPPPLPVPVPSIGSVPPPPFVPDVPVPSTAPAVESVFPQTAAPNIDVSSIISKRLNAMRRLQENPMDPEAIKMMYNSQKEMSSWASSKHLPGQFTGSTGVNVLKVHELNSGPQAWARRDTLTSTQPVTGGMGMQLLQKMGWKPGEGLGREKTGSLQPLLLDVKLDKRGLVAKDDNNAASRRAAPVHKKRPASVAQAQQQLTEKHPVCLLNELTSKRKWTPPLYTLVNEMGPSHSKMFLFSVQINGQTYTPDRACNTKKEAKLVAAKYCLQQIGILPG